MINVIYRTKYNQYSGENIKLVTAVEFISLLTAHIPDKHKHLTRYYSIYSSSSKGKARGTAVWTSSASGWE